MICREDYDHLMNSGLYRALTEKGLLIPHRELPEHRGITPDAYKVIEPELVSFISYPYEWSFSQLKDAALATLEVQQAALRYGMTLKDGSAYNIQFHGGKPVFIDTLSLEIYREGSPWQAYRQFCQHFLAPLALMSYTDIRLNQLLKIYLDGIPLDLAAELLPFTTRLKFSTLMHIHLHAGSQARYESRGSAGKSVRISKANLAALVVSLTGTVRKLRLKRQRTEWGRYYTFTNYSDRAFAHKKEIVGSFLQEIRPLTVWDLGANTGEFTRIAAGLGAQCIAFDIDPLAVESHYLDLKHGGIENILPLVMDLTNPSPSIGWNNGERMGVGARPRPDAILALALIHHLAISNNLPFRMIASFFSGLSDNLVIEFVPKSDSQVRKLLESRKDIFGAYDEASFAEEFSRFFTIVGKECVAGSERTLYRMKRTG